MSENKEKSKKATIFAVLGLLLGFATVLLGCEIAFDGMRAFEAPFFAEIEGRIDGNEVKAIVYCDPTEHKTKEIYNKMTVTFSSPASLDGITVSLRSDGKATVRLRDVDEELPLFGGLVEPFLFLMQGSEPFSVQRVDDGYEVIYEREDERLKCLFDDEGIPKSAEGRYFGHEISLSVPKFYKKSK